MQGALNVRIPFCNTVACKRRAVWCASRSTKKRDTTAQITGIVNTGWTDSTAAPLRTISLTTPKALTSGTYWLRAVKNTGTCVTSYKGTGGDRRTITAGGAPANFSNLWMAIGGCTP